ncbi:uncharacterized protein VTP21DRAFT_1879 [Calcarisporiella thermophila]|uniref:uncharacterized protein n=1 Tax=Calcarisporiella thermophila TaxID=911321 RepID=UPI003744629F
MIEFSALHVGIMALLLLTLTVFVFLHIASPKPCPLSPSQRQYLSPNSKTPQPLPSLLESPTLDLSLVIPAYNETARLPHMLDETIQHLRSLKLKYEILIVDDGSKDATTDCALRWAQKNGVDELRVFKLPRNRGKGGAVTQGMLSVRGSYILMVDADGATQFSDLDKLRSRMSDIEREGLGVVVGSRSHLVTTDAVVKRSFIRNFLMRGFHMLVYLLGVRGIEDTQCGFKLFTRKAAQRIFSNMHVEGWIFDVEVLVLARRMRIPVVEEQVNWHEVDGSKISLMRDSVQMAIDLMVIRLSYLLRVWRVVEPKQKGE